VPWVNICAVVNPLKVMLPYRIFGRADCGGADCGEGLVGGDGEGTWTGGGEVGVGDGVGDGGGEGSGA